MFDYLIVGAGFAGSVLAERLANGLNKKVLICDVRNHIGGMRMISTMTPVFSCTRTVRISFIRTRATCSPTFRTLRNGDPYQHRVKVAVDGQLVPMPINLDTINQLYGLTLTEQDVDAFLASVAEPPRIYVPPRTWLSAKSGANSTKSSSGATPANNGASILRSWMQVLPHAYQPGRIAMIATSPTRIRQCRCTATHACLSGCWTTPTSKSCLTPITVTLPTSSHTTP